MKLWSGRTDGTTEQLADDFNSSIRFDSRMYRQDITGSMAHAAMLGAQGILTEDEADTLIDGLQEILNDIESGKLAIPGTGKAELGSAQTDTPEDVPEDIHMFVEQVLTERLGAVGKKLHTARSRNDQVTLDLRLYLREAVSETIEMTEDLMQALIGQAKRYAGAIMPGYTHLQRAQPVSFGHHLLAYVEMLLRDRDRLLASLDRMNVSPIGSCALAGTTYDTDRHFEARRLQFDRVCRNSMDGVSDRDYVVELLSDYSILMMHLSRLSEEIILWSSWEFQFIELSDAYTTGSSIMPQKKNSDMAELIRGKTGRVYGDLMGTLTMLKGLPLAYNKDMQEDKESIFDAVDTVKLCLPVMTGMIETMTVKTGNLRKAAEKGFINATDLADYLVGKGLAFRDAYKISGQIVAECLRTGETLESMSLESYKSFCGEIGADVYDAVNLEACVNRRTSYGGTSVENVKEQIQEIEESLS